MPPPAAPASQLLSLLGVRVRFPSLLAVKDVSFNLGAGQLLGLIGPNGAGKTTLLRAIAGLQPLTAGTIHVLGEPLRSADLQTTALVGFTPDTPSLYEGLTVRDFLRFIAKGYSLDEREGRERIDFWLEKVWLKDKADQKISALSRGMRQRIGIARTLLPNPHVVLLDEPAAGIDPAGRVQFRQLLVDLRQQGKALIVSSHILSDMAEYCSHVGIMAKGAMIRFGTVDEISQGIEQSAAAASRCRYRLTLAGEAPSLSRLLTDTEGVSLVEVNHQSVRFEFLTARERAAELLTKLVTAGVPLASFAPEAHDLESAYLRANVGQVD